ncbi:S1/P1 nuclease [Hyphobacterium marinum]|uniref:S1/P1 nuclease n=1 Tax=Hyphobacterium marinum TaxID=3116574 RepID=A0ABU7M012_9PROT|nr:S1/P1 nuclease [Hyphobacterium sp. Y6023]MEE2566755.1 S1/P1 nuclease [Hyphobacterium sp. Y6023]
MKRMLAILSALLISAAPASGWGKIGHRVTGAIAERYLTDEARAAVRDILGVETLAEAAEWADFMRSNDEEFWRNSSSLHYVTVPVGTAYDPANAPQSGDAFTALERFSAMVVDADAPLEDRQLALRMIVHIIGDLHQPFHVGSGEDRGGNDVTVVWFDTVTTLHLAWDEDMVEYEQLSYTEMTDWLDARITPELAAEWMDPDPLVWIAESAAVRDSLYPDDAELRYDYFYEHRDLMRLRLSQGGVRIAAYLNALFAEEVE